MAYEKGGRADKFGNRYENRWVVEQLLKLCKERILSLVHEPIDESTDGVDIQIHNIDESIELHQCKGKNANKNDWSISDLNAKNILSRAKKHLDSAKKHHYKFISSISCQAMETLIERAKNSSDNPMDFYEYQIKARAKIIDSEIERNFLSFLNHLELTINESDIAAAIDYLSRMEFIIVPDSDYKQKELIERISDIFTADPETIYKDLITYTVENDKLGHHITISEINKYFADKGLYKIDLSNHSQVWGRINTLNDEFESSFVPLDYGLIQREETSHIYSLILENKSVIIHGKAGSGKSGCIQELIQVLKENNMPYLALTLDKRTPEKSANQYGIDTLELPASPVSCLSKLAPNKNCVLILDQLDAIRWTSQHNKTALEACKDLINQAERINNDSYQKSNVSIIFVCRTVDKETDNGIKSLFNKEDKDKRKTEWEEFKIGELSDDIIKLVAGEYYSTFTPKFKDLLKNINNIYIWSKLNDERKKIQYASAYHLIQGYWEQFVQKCESLDITHTEVYKVKKSLIDKMILISRTVIPKFMLQECSPKIISMTISEGILIENNSKISFVHQSFHDVFIVEAMVDKIYSGTPIKTLLGSPEQQHHHVVISFKCCKRLFKIY